MQLSKKTWCPDNSCGGTFRRRPKARFAGDPSAPTSEFFWEDKCDACGYQKFTIKCNGSVSYIRVR